MAEVLVEFGLLVFFAALAGILAIRFKQPTVIFLLLVGAVVGPRFLNIVSQTEIISSLSEVGAILLLFAIGVEFSLVKLKNFDVSVLLTALSKIALSFFFFYQLSAWLGFDEVLSLYVALMLSITSTTIFIKLAEYHGVQNKREVQTLLAMLIVEDVFAVFGIAFLSNLSSSNTTTVGLLLSIARSLAILGFAYLVFYQVFKRLFASMELFLVKDVQIFLSLAIGLGFSYFASVVGLAPSIGAFLAGSLVASMPKGKLLEEAISPFVLAFSSIFFISMGMLADFSSVYSNWVVFAIICVATIVFHFASTALATYFFGFSRQSAVFSGVAMISAGEFSLLLAQEGAGVVQFDLIGLASIVVLTSAIVNSILLPQVNAVDALLVRLVPSSIQRSTRSFVSRFSAHNVVVHTPLGFFTSFANRMKTIFTDLAQIGVLLGFIALGWIAFNRSTVDFFGFSIPIFGIVVALALLLLLRPLFSLFEVSRALGHAHQFTVVKILFVSLALIFSLVFLSIFKIDLLFRQFVPLFLAVLLLAWMLFSERKQEQKNVLLFKK